MRHDFVELLKKNNRKSDLPASSQSYQPLWQRDDQSFQSPWWSGSMWSLCSYTVFTARVLKFQRVMVLGSLCETTWFRTTVGFGNLEKRAETPARLEKKHTNPGHVGYCLLHDEVQLMCVAVQVMSIFIPIHDFAPHTSSAPSLQQHCHKPGR